MKPPVGIVVLGMTVLMIAVSCGGGSSSSSSRSGETPSSTAPPDAVLFLAAVDKYRRHAGESAEIAQRRIRTAMQSCRSLGAGHPQPLQDRVNEGLDRLEFVMQGKVLAGPYGEYSAELARIETSNPALKVVQENVAIVASEHNKLAAADVDPCDALRRWRDLGWPVGYERRLQVDLYNKVGLDRSRLRTAAKAVSDTLPQLQELELSFEDAVKISSSGMLVA
jgi:hypothetical protein